MGQQKVRVIPFLGVGNESKRESNYLVGGVEQSLIEQVKVKVKVKEKLVKVIKLTLLGA